MSELQIAFLLLLLVVAVARLAALREEEADEHGTSLQHAARHRETSRDLIRIERATAVRLRDEGRIGDEELRELLHDLDLAESRLE